MKSILSKPLHPQIYLLTLLACLLEGCQSAPPPTADMAVSKAEVSNAAAAGGTEFAPVEMASARDKLSRANQAMAAKDYKSAKELADSAQADAQLAQSKANTAKAQQAAAALQDNIRVLREELDRSNPSNPN